MVKLSEAILRYRVQRNLSQKAFALKVGVTPQTVYNIETVGQSPSKMTKAKIMLVLGDEYSIDKEDEDGNTEAI